MESRISQDFKTHDLGTNWNNSNYNNNVPKETELEKLRKSDVWSYAANMQNPAAYMN